MNIEERVYKAKVAAVRVRKHLDLLDKELSRSNHLLMYGNEQEKNLGIRIITAIVHELRI